MEQACISTFYWHRMLILGGWSKVQGHHAYSSLGKAFEKQTKTIEDQGEKQKQLKSV